MRKWILVLVSLAAVGLAAAIMRSGAAVKPPTSVDKAFVVRNNDFGLNVLNKLSAGSSDKNVFISPTSLEMALAMTYNGASGSTQKAMAEAMRLQGLSLDSVNRNNQALMSSFRSDKGMKLDVANSIWARSGYRFLPDFISRVRQFYSAEVATLAFGPAAVNRINSWVSGHTNSKIKSIIKELKPLDVMVLVNAVYFKGTWAAKFDKAETRNAPFTLASGKKVTIPMMTRHGSYKWSQAADLSAIELPYAGKKASMIILLPSSPSGLPKLMAGLSAEKLNKIISRMGSDDLDIVMPKFKLEYEAVDSLKAALSQMGMGVAFGMGADFSKMTGKDDLYISRIAHKTFVDVNEEGTEAAAATSVTMTVKAMPIPLRMIVDHPFLCIIRENKTGAILFVGAINNPAQK